MHKTVAMAGRALVGNMSGFVADGIMATRVCSADLQDRNLDGGSNEY